MNSTPVTVAYGDGIGPEIMGSALHIIREAGARIEIERVEIGERMYREGYSTGIPPAAWESLNRTRIFLKGPVTTPKGKGFRNLNVYVRKTLGLFANIRPCVSYYPFISNRGLSMNVVVIRENEEDLYAGIEHRQTDEVYQTLKLISRPGSERVIRYAFEYANDRERKKVTCMTKASVMKLTDGLFAQVFDEISQDYPAIESEHISINKGAALLASEPALFDVIVVPNLYGDIVADMATELAGPWSIGASVSIGDVHAMFRGLEPSRPEIAGKDEANPSGMIIAAAKMLAHIQQGEIAERVHNAWIKTIEDGIHTADLFDAETTKLRAGTQEFTKAVVDRLGQVPVQIPEIHYHVFHDPLLTYQPKEPAVKALVGVDVFIHMHELSADGLAKRLLLAEANGLKLIKITNRGIKVWPDQDTETIHTDHWRCRFLGSHDHAAIEHKDITGLLDRITDQRIDTIKTENLYLFNGEPGF